MEKKQYEKAELIELCLCLEDTMSISTLEGEDEESMSKDFIIW